MDGANKLAAITPWLRSIADENDGAPEIGEVEFQVDRIGSTVDSAEPPEGAVNSSVL